MAQLLKAWLIDDVGMHLDEDVSVEKEFATGYLLGELLARLDLQPDFEKFDPAETPDARINNFNRLQKSLKTLGISMDSRKANAIMTEEKGFVMRLLYQIKSKVASLHKGLNATTGATGRTAGGAAGGARPTYGLLEKQSHRSQHAAYRRSQADQLDRTLRRTAGNPKVLMQGLHLQRFQRMQQKLETHAAEATEADRRAQADAKRELRESLVGTLRKKREEGAKLLETQHREHKQAVDRRRAYFRDDLRVEVSLAEKRGRIMDERHEREGQEAESGIDMFEGNLRRMGADGSTGTEGAVTGDTHHATPLDTMRKIVEIVPRRQALLDATEGYVRQLKAKRADDILVRREREARRRRMVVEQVSAAAEMDRRTRQEALMELLRRQSRAEEKVAERVWRVRQEEQVMVENRALREKQYRERRERDWSEAIEREVAAMKAVGESVARLSAAELAALQAERARVEAARKAAVLEECTRCAWGLVGIAERCANYREHMEVNAPRKEHREWVSMFTSDDPALVDGIIPDPEEHEPEPEPKASVLATAAVQLYLSKQGEWQRGDATARASAAETGSVRAEEPSGAEAEGAAEPPRTLAGVLHELLEGSVAADAPPLPTPPDLTTMPVKLAVVGAPFSGKSTIAREIAVEHQLAVITPEDVVEAALAAAEAYVPPSAVGDGSDAAAEPEASGDAAAPEGDGTEEGGAAEGDGAEEGGEASGAEESAARAEPEAPEVVRLGRECRAALDAGEAVPDAVLCRLVALEIAALSDRLRESKAENEAPESEAPAPKTKGKKKEDKAGKAKPAKGGKGGAEAAELPEPANGFVLDGFPQTERQARLLERSLTQLDMEAEAIVRERRSVVVPPPPPAARSTRRLLHSGLDGVLLLGMVSEEEAIKRAQGRRVDPETGAVYHVEARPPPTNNPGLVARLVGADDPSNSEQQIQARIEAFLADRGPLVDWFSRFEKLLHDVDSELTLDDEVAAGKEAAGRIRGAQTAAGEVAKAIRSAEKAVEAARAAEAEGVRAAEAAKAAAKALFAAKRAEVEAAQLLAGVTPQAAGGAAAKGGKGGKGGKGAPPPPVPAEDLPKGGLSAQEMLNQNASEAIAQSLANAEAAAKEAEVAAAQAQAECGHANEHVEACRGARADVDASVQAREAAEAAAAQADELLDAAAGAARRAQEAAQAAQAALEKAQAAAALAEGEELPEEEPEEGAEAGEDVQPRAESPGGGDAAEAPAEPTRGAVAQESAKALWARWNEAESTYLRALEALLGEVRVDRAKAMRHVVISKRQALQMLTADDGRQAHVDAFLKELKEREQTMFRDTLARNEVLEQADALRDKIWDMCDARLAELDKYRKQLSQDPAITNLANAGYEKHGRLLALEMERLGSAAAVAVAASCEAWGVHPPGAADQAAQPVPPAPDVTKPAPSELAALARAVNAADVPGLTEAEKAGANSPLGQLAAAIRTSLAYTNALAAYDPVAAPAGGKGGGKAKGGGEAESVSPLEHARRAQCSAEVAAVLAPELEATRDRVISIWERAQGHAKEMGESWRRTQERLEAWGKERYTRECKAVSTAVTAVAQAVQSKHPVPTSLVLDGPSLHLEALKLTSIQQALAELAELAPVGMAPAQDVALALHRALHGQHPGPLGSCTVEEMTEALTALDHAGCNGVDWREAVIEVLLEAYPALASLSPALVAQTVSAMEQAAVGGDAGASLLARETWSATPLWWERPLDELETAAMQVRGQKPGKLPAPKRSGRKCTTTQTESLAAATEATEGGGAALKEVLFDLLGETAADGELVVPVLEGLLQLLKDLDPDVGLRKAWACVTGNEAGGAIGADLLHTLVAPVRDAGFYNGMPSVGDVEKHLRDIQEAELAAAEQEGEDGDDEEDEEEEEEELPPPTIELEALLSGESKAHEALRAPLARYGVVGLADRVRAIQERAAEAASTSRGPSQAGSRAPSNRSEFE
ncbi:unnamed protein product [Pedinophyceae sp. YPF-701]|nr:unnamed protein product [Pedinophyceae sp. YPF-701]